MTVGALTIDVEDWFQVSAYEAIISPEDWPSLALRVERNVDRILALLDAAQVKASFFCLAWVAKRAPHMVRRIADAGHEIASHGCHHQRVETLGPQAFANDVVQSKAVLEDMSGQKVVGYRAPNFSISHRTSWAHGLLVDAGFRYSSSVAPFAHDHYGWPGAKRVPWTPVRGHDFLEIPIATCRLFGRILPCAGGGFFRLYPYTLSRWLLQRAQAQGIAPIFYLHPWEFDPGQPQPADAPIHVRVRHRLNLSRVDARFAHLLDDFIWTRLDQLAAHWRKTEA